MSSSAYAIANHVIYRREWFGGITYSGATKEVRFFNHSAALVIEQFAQPSELRMVREVVGPLIEDATTLSEFFTWLQASGIVEQADPDGNRARPRLFFTDVTEFSTDRFHAPIGVELELTLRCMRRCAYCAYESSPVARTEGDLGRPSYKRLLEDLRKVGILCVRFTGGDPLVRPDALDIFEDADREGFPLMVASDLTVLSKNHAERLSELSNLLAVQTTLDGPTAHLADALRGVGNFRRVLKGIELLRGHGIPVIVGTILTKLNVNAIYETARLLADLNVSYCVSPLYSAGRGRALDHLIPDDDDLASAYEQFGAAVHDGLVRPADPAWNHLAGESLPDVRRALWTGQPWLVRSPDRLLRIDPSGRCYTSIHLKEFIGEDVYVGTIDGSEDILSLWHEAPLLNELRRARKKHPYYGDVIDLRDSNAMKEVTHAGETA